VVIPDRQLREEACPTDRRHNFVAKKSKVLLRIVVKNADGDILDSCPYALEVAGRIAKGTSSGKGMIQEPVPADARNATLTLWLDEAGEGQSFCWPLEIASLDPVEYLTGVQARLNNLGYNAGSIDGIFGPKSRAAVLAFQKDYDLDPDAIPGPITQGKLKDQYGC